MKGSLVAILWLNFTWRHWKRAPKSTILLVLILALGVGVFFSIRLANRAAVAGFSLFTENLTGVSDFVITSSAGELPEGLLPELRKVSGNLPVAMFPVVQTTASQPIPMGEAASDGFNAEQFDLLGLDLFALPNLIYLTDGKYRPPQGVPDGPGEKAAARETVPRRDAVFITKALASRETLAPGDELEVIVNDRRVTLVVSGVLPETEFQAPNPANLLLMDLPAVQRLSDQRGVLHRIELRLPPGPLHDEWTARAEERLAAAADGRWEIEAPSAGRASGADMTRALRLNLTILSGLALIVGVYLILQALEAGVVKRRPEIAVLRSLGVPPRAIRNAWFVEALALGMAGSLLGLLSGWFGAQFSVRAVARTVNSLYYSNTTEAAAFDWGEAGLALAVGLVASALAGWLPARDAAATPPAEVLQRGVRGGGIRLLRRPLVGLALLAAGLGAAFLPPLMTSGKVALPIGGYFAAGLWVVGSSIVAGLAFTPLARLIGIGGGVSAALRCAASQLRRPTGRHRLAGAGLVIAVGMSAGMSILVGSFEYTVTSWIGQVLKADLYVACHGVGNISSRNRMTPETWRALASDPDVAEVERGQAYRVRIDGVETHLFGGDFGERSGWSDFHWLKGPSVPLDRLHESLEGGLQPVLINESFGYRFRKTVGDSVELPTPSKTIHARVVGVFADYGNDRGTIAVPRRLVSEWFGNENLTTMSVYLAEGADAEAVRRRWQGKHTGIVVRTHAKLREEVMRVFRETFVVTDALKWIGVAVAIVGQALALVSILLERRRELATMKELGMTRREIARSVGIEGAGLGLAGTAGGLALSVALGYLLIYVINRQSFGWTLAFRIPVLELVTLAVAVIIMSWVIAQCAGYWGAKLPSDREE